MAKMIRDLTGIIEHIRSYHMNLNATHTPDIYDVWAHGEITRTKSPNFYSKETQKMFEVVSRGIPGRGLPADSLYPKFGRSRIAVNSSYMAYKVQELILSVNAEIAADMYEVEVPRAKGNPVVEIKLKGPEYTQYVQLAKDEVYQLVASLQSVIREIETEKK